MSSPILSKDFLQSFSDAVSKELRQKKSEIAARNIEMLLNFLTKEQYKIVMKAIIEDDYRIISMHYYAFPIIALTVLGFTVDCREYGVIYSYA